MRGKAVALPSLLALSLALVAPVLAAKPAVMPAPDANQVTIERAQAAAQAENCPGALALLDPLVAGLAPGPDRIAVQRMRLICLSVVGRVNELPGVQSELATSLPRDGVVKAFGVLIAADENRFTDAADQITSIATTSPHSLDILTGAAVRTIAVRLEAQNAKDVRGRMVIALARADWEPTDYPEMRIGFTEDAIEALIDRGQPDEAETLLDRIDQPELLSQMVVDRHYAALWPAIEARLGPASATSADGFARDKLAVYASGGTSEAALRDAANAMLLLGRYQDVLDMTADVHVSAEMSRDAVRILLFRARALAALHRPADAEKLLGTFATVDVRRSPAALPALISYAEFLDENGQSVQGLAAARDARTRAGDVLNDVGKRWLDRTEVCTLSALGRTAEANSAMDALKAKADQNPSAAVEALLCARRDAEASSIAVKSFDNVDAASDLVLQFQPGGSVWAPGPSRLRDLWTAFLARPEVKAAFERKGRIMPRVLWPSPKPRPIPRAPSGGASLT